MKFFLYCITISLISILNIDHIYGQNFQDRYKEIEKRLNILSDTLIPGLNETANFSVENTSLQDLMRGIASTHKLNVNIDPSVNERITNNFTNVKVKDLLLFLVKEYKLDIEFLSNILSFSRFKLPEREGPVEPRKLAIEYNLENDKLTVDLLDNSVKRVAKKITDLTNHNLILAPNVRDRNLNGFIKNMPFEQALDKIAYMNGMEMEKTTDGFFIWKYKEPINTPVNQNNNRNNVISRNQSGQGSNASGELYVDLMKKNKDTLINIDAVNVPIADVVQEVSSQANKNFVFTARPEGNITCFVESLTYNEFLNFVLNATEYTYKKQESIYLIGKRKQEGLRTTKLIRLQFRTVDSLDVFIPKEIKEGLDIKIFKELNALILTGSTTQINEVSDFIKAIDVPVPNIMIEVIVADFNKGASIQTGLKAFLSDSVPARTSGQVFPGVDVTLSSGSVNEFLNKLDEKGIVNLGRVTPRFYATLQAMEQNNYLSLRSTPKLSTLNGHNATLTIGQSRFYLEETQNITGGVSPINSVSQIWNEVEANLTIDIYPIVSSDDHITLDVYAEFSDFVEPELEGAPPGSTTRKFTSKIRVKNEDMVVLGGMEEVRRFNSSSGAPVLSKIPILKWIFSSRNVENEKSRLLVFIKPTVVY